MVMTVGAFFQALRPWAEAPGVPATWTWTDLTQKFMVFICWFDQQNVGMGIISKSGDHGFYGYTGDCWSLSTCFFEEVTFGRRRVSCRCSWKSIRGWLFWGKHGWCGWIIYIYLVMHFVNDDHLITICTIRRFCREKCEETLWCHPLWKLMTITTVAGDWEETRLAK